MDDNPDTHEHSDSCTHSEEEHRAAIRDILEALGPDTARTELRQVFDNPLENPELIHAHQMRDLARIRELLDDLERDGHYKAIVIGIVKGSVDSDDQEVIACVTGEMRTGVLVAQHLANQTARQFLEAQAGNLIDDPAGDIPGYERPPIPEDFARAFGTEDD